MTRPPPILTRPDTLFPNTTRFRSPHRLRAERELRGPTHGPDPPCRRARARGRRARTRPQGVPAADRRRPRHRRHPHARPDRIDRDHAPRRHQVKRPLPAPSKRTVIVLAWVGGVMAVLLILGMLLAIARLTSDYEIGRASGRDTRW